MTPGNNKKFEWVFFKNLVARQIRQDYLENITGFAWLILQPLILLAVYAFVFSTIFKARIPEAGDIGFVPYLAVAFWPWTAFSEAVLRANNSITANAALIGKVALATEQIPLASVTATFIMHLTGYLAVLIVLQLLGTGVHWLFLGLAIIVLLLRLRDRAVHQCHPGVRPRPGADLAAVDDVLVFHDTDPVQPVLPAGIHPRDRAMEPDGLVCRAFAGTPTVR